MEFLNPSAFYILPAIAIVTLLHFLKLRRQRHVVPSVIFWLEAIEDMKANVPFQRLRNSLLLPLQIVFLLAVIGSIARPALRHPSPLIDQSIIIIDTSTSMGTTELGKSRLDAAKAEALKRIDQLDANAQMMIMDTSSALGSIRQGFTSDKAQLRQACTNLRVQHVSPDLKAVFDAVQVYASTPGTQVFFISDNFEGLPEAANQVPLQRILVGERGDNVAIVRLSVARQPNPSDQYQVVADVQSFSETRKTFRVQLEIEGREIYDQTIALPPRETQPIEFSFDDRGFDGQIVSVRLVDLDDDLLVDNIASAVLHPPPIWKVSLVSNRQQPTLTAIFKTNPQVELNRMRTEDYHSGGEADIVVFDQFVPSQLPEGNLIFLNPIDGLPFMPVQKNVRPIRVIDQHATHEVMRYVALIDLEVKTSLKGQLPVWGVPLAETNEGTALIWLGAHSERKIIVFAFDPFDLEISDFALFEKSIASPFILMSQCIEWLASDTAPIQPDSVKTGEPVKIRLGSPYEVERITVQLPDGTQREISARVPSVVFGGTTQVGVYTVFIDNQQLGRFAANLLDPQESNLSPSSLGENPKDISAAADGVAMPRQSDLLAAKQEIWQYTAFLAFVLLAVEWWVYHRNP